MLGLRGGNECIIYYYMPACVALACSANLLLCRTGYFRSLVATGHARENAPSPCSCEWSVKSSRAILTRSVLSRCSVRRIARLWSLPLSQVHVNVSARCMRTSSNSSRTKSPPSALQLFIIKYTENGCLGTVTRSVHRLKYVEKILLSKVFH